ncbi:AEC family transporter, partial [Lacticaseibacillus paracasei]
MIPPLWRRLPASPGRHTPSLDAPLHCGDQNNFIKECQYLTAFISSVFGVLEILILIAIGYFL